MQETSLARYNALFDQAAARDNQILELNRQVTTMQAELHRIEVSHASELAALRLELNARDRTIDELRAELNAERKLRQQLQRRLAEIDPEFSLAETETKA